MAITQPTYPIDTTPRRAGLMLALVIALHIVAIAILLSLDVLPLPARLATLMVRVTQAPPKQTEFTPPRPKPVTNKSVAQNHPEPAPERPLLAAETQAPAAVEAPASKQIPRPAPPPVVATATPVAAASEPRFDAAYLDNPAPGYPALSRRMGEEGQVILRVFVEPNGRPSQVQIKTGSGSPRLDQAAQEAVWRWKFFPARRGAEAIGAWVLVPIDFNLRG
ncbi:MAG: energy transducer TonB [Betaproteobacteria bacterium]|nr:energy transducer TonB [Betaproteobacteria bacterium]